MDTGEIIQIVKDTLFNKFHEIITKKLFREFDSYVEFNVRCDAGCEMMIYVMEKNKCDNDMRKFIAYYLIGTCRYNYEILSNFCNFDELRLVTIDDIMALTDSSCKWGDIVDKIGENYKNAYYTKNICGTQIIFVECNVKNHFYALEYFIV